MLQGLLQSMGFASVYDCRNPIGNIYVGRLREFAIWDNRITFAAIKGLLMGHEKRVLKSDAYLLTRDGGQAILRRRV